MATGQVVNPSKTFELVEGSISQASVKLAAFGQRFLKLDPSEREAISSNGSPQE